MHHKGEYKCCCLTTSFQIVRKLVTLAHAYVFPKGIPLIHETGASDKTLAGKYVLENYEVIILPTPRYRIFITFAHIMLKMRGIMLL